MKTNRPFEGYESSELKLSVYLDAYGIRDEAERRQSILRKEYERLEKRISAIEREQAELGEAITAAWIEIRK